MVKHIIIYNNFKIKMLLSAGIWFILSVEKTCTRVFHLSLFMLLYIFFFLSVVKMNIDF